MEEALVVLSIRSVQIDWDRRIDKHPSVLKTVDQMLRYLLKPKILDLLDTEKHPTYRLIPNLKQVTAGFISGTIFSHP